MYFDSRFWAGTEESLHAYLQSLKLDASAMGQSYTNGDKSAEQEVPRLFSQSGNVAVISINGALVNNDSWMNEYRGVTGYPEIRAALIYAATKPGVGAIVLDINSGGGSVAGVSDTSDLISTIDKKMMPVYAHSDGGVMSAAYWLASSARSLSVGKVAESGSIGVLMVHKEMSKMLKDEGVTATVLRAGEFKALGNPYEALSDKAKVELQGQLDVMYEMFVTHVADARGVTYASADKKMAQGRVFIGEQAVTAGLVDKVSTFDAVVAKASQGIDAKKNNPQYGASLQKGSQMKVALTDQQLAAALEAGTLGDAAVVEKATKDAKALSDQKVLDDAAAAAVPAAAAPAPAESADLVAFLKESLAAANTSVTSLTMEVRDAKAASAALSASHAPMRAIAVTSVERLRVALDRPAAGAEALDDVALLAEHASLRVQFEAKFKAGGVAAVSAGAPADNAGNADDPVRKARLASTRPTK
jgi:signal peptide peptidase SppA